MSEPDRPPVGSIGWIDLTVDNAEKVRDFYRQVVGWEATSVDMGEYEDFTMSEPGSGNPVAGVCHARGSNAEIPPSWILYVIVESLDESVKKCTELGGEVIGSMRDMGAQGRFCIVRDPAGAAIALFQTAG